MRKPVSATEKTAGASVSFDSIPTWDTKTIHSAQKMAPVSKSPQFVRPLTSGTKFHTSIDTINVGGYIEAIRTGVLTHHTEKTLDVSVAGPNK
jgi:hypothetical protein